MDKTPCGQRNMTAVNNFNYTPMTSDICCRPKKFWIHFFIESSTTLERHTVHHWPFYWGGGLQTFRQFVKGKVSKVYNVSEQTIVQLTDFFKLNVSRQHRHKDLSKTEKWQKTKTFIFSGNDERTWTTKTCKGVRQVLEDLYSSSLPRLMIWTNFR